MDRILQLDLHQSAKCQSYSVSAKCQLYSEFKEGQFIKITSGGLLKDIIIGNIYRPPRDLSENYK